MLSNSTLFSTSADRLIRSCITRFSGIHAVGRPSRSPWLLLAQPGIGTFLNPGVVSPLLEWLAKTADLAMAWYCIHLEPLCRFPPTYTSLLRYLNAHVRAGYKFLMQNYRQGDKICLFGQWDFPSAGCSERSYSPHHVSGFSRGAYTARALAGFLFKVRPQY